MASLNHCTFIGNLGRDPEVRYMPSGEAVASISIACTEEWKDKTSGEKKSATEWINVKFFGKLAEIAGQYLKKGSSVYVSGSMKTRKYTDRAGVEKYATEIKGDQMVMLGGRSDAAEQEAPAQAPAQSQAARTPAPAQRRTPAPAASFDDMDDQIPF